MNTQIYIIDSSAIFSGKNLIFPNADLYTTPGVQQEFSPGGKDYRRFQLLTEIGMHIQSPSSEYIHHTQKIIEQQGEQHRLSPTDIELIALAYELHKTSQKKVQLLTDDYSIQNIAKTMNIPYLPINQKGITKKFKWATRCPACGKTYQASIEICQICGSKTTFSHNKK